MNRIEKRHRYLKRVLPFLALAALSGCDLLLDNSQRGAPAPLPVASETTGKTSATDAGSDLPSPAFVFVRLHSGFDRFQAGNLPAAALESLRELDSGDEAWNTWFAVYAGSPIREDQLPMLGEHRLDEGMLEFIPRFPLRDGATYTVVWRDHTLLKDGKPAEIKLEYKLDAPKPTPPAELSAVYPLRNVLPENQLKFYLHFSAPMSRGEAYERIHLLKASGEEVESPFLKLGEELWDDSGTRFTLFFDPGRIKQGLKPREDLGPSLEAGESYTLVIDKEWLDAHGKPLKVGLRKSFRAIEPDDAQPDVKEWKLTAPKQGTIEPLVALFNEPLDHAMLHRVLAVVDADGKHVSGKIEVDREETRWRLTPLEPWKPGKFTLVVDATLEDLAGNSLAKPFEVDVFDKIDKQPKVESVEIPFEVE